MTGGSRKIILAGGSGFLGCLLTRWCCERGLFVVVLTRSDTRPANCASRRVRWNGRTVGLWKDELEGAAAVINLAGRSVDCRYTDRNRRDILASRIDSTRVLGEAISRCADPPAVWLNSSTATIYKHAFDRSMDEIDGEVGATPEVKDAFSVEVAQAWEEAAMGFELPETRRVLLRTAMVFGIQPGGVLHVLRRLSRTGLGGAMGGGKQSVSWIRETDFCRAVEWLIDHPPLSGAVNLAAPHPLTNATMMRQFRETCGWRFGLPIPRTLLELGAVLLRTETELVIKSRRVVPRRLLESGFRFEFPHFASALADLERRVQNRPTHAIQNAPPVQITTV